MAHLKKVEKGAENEVRQVSNGHAPHLEKWWFHAILVVAHAPGGVAHVKAGHLWHGADLVGEEVVRVAASCLGIRERGEMPCHVATFAKTFCAMTHERRPPPWG